MKVDTQETIVAVSTPIGRGAISQVRLSGPQASRIAQERLAVGPSSLKPRQASVGHFLVGETPVDQVVVVSYQGPYSYTGEDLVEISCHGNPLICRKIVEACIESGARLAEPGEFTYRAFLNGKLDLSQAEAVADLVESQTEFQLQVARQQLDGQLSRELIPLKNRLVEVITQMETAIEFVEEAITTTTQEMLRKEISDIHSQLHQLAETFNQGRILQEGLKAVLSGRPNTGKSSIFNKLLKYERAIVTPYAGTTRDTLLEKLDLEGIPVLLVDTAGIREIIDPIEVKGVERSKQNIREADLVLFVLDNSQEWGQEDHEIWDQIRDLPYLIVRNKIDLSPAINIPADVKVQAAGEVKVSATKEKNIHQLAESIVRTAVPEWRSAEKPGVMVTHLRHQKALVQADESLLRALEADRKRVSEEYILYDLRKALESMGEISGQTTTEDILDRIFSTFCIGK